jgi:DNA invertase Pin-like site-specific DNA recombinase
MNYILYFRCSTRSQSDSGLGLDAQRKAVENYLANKPHKIVEEFTEVESGRKSNRPELTSALKACKKYNAVLLVARTDRLSRNVHFLSGLLEQKVEFVAADNPHATNLTLHIMAAVAEEEARLISIRTKAALAEAKKRGVKLGKHAKVLNAISKAKSDKFAKEMKSAVKDAVLKLRKKDEKVTYRNLADFLNKKKIKTDKGYTFSSGTVYRMCSRVGLDIHAVA